MAPILEVTGLKKSYKQFMLRDVSFAVPEDCITGFIGVNGAGKSTTIHSILNLIHRDAAQLNFAVRIYPKMKRILKTK